MKKILLAASAIALTITLAACGTSTNEATIKNLSNQLDDTSNTLSDIKTVNTSNISMSKNTLSALATKDESIYDTIIGTQQSLLNEEYYKTNILSKTAKIKSCLSNDLKLSKAQSNAIKDLTNNLSKYTNSVSYTKNELESSIKSVASMKKNASKNSEKIAAKLNRIACNSNTRSAYYENIINTLNQLENFLCCDDCNKQNQEFKIENEDTNTETKINSQNNSTKNTHNEDNQNNKVNQNYAEKTSNTTTKKGLPINIDTYAPLNRNVDSMAYYNNRMAGYNNYDYGAYGMSTNGFNGTYGYGYGYNGLRSYPTRPLYPYPNNYAYPYAAPYNSNTLNRINYNNAVPVSETETSDFEDFKNKAEQRLEDFEEIKDGQIQKIEDIGKDAIKKDEALNVSAREIKKTKIIKDSRTQQEIEEDLNQPIIAH